jgi:hypothetical protein
MVIDKIPQSTSNLNTLDDLAHLLKTFPDDDPITSAVALETETDPTKVVLGEPIAPVDIGRLQAREALEVPEYLPGAGGRIQYSAVRETGPTLNFKSGPSISPTKMPS